MLKVALAGLLLASGADAFAPLAAPAMGVRARATARVAPQNFGPRMLLGGETATRSTMKMLPAAPVMQRMPALNMASTATDGKKAPIDFQLIAYFFLWYLGNYFCEAPPRPRAGNRVTNPPPQGPGHMWRETSPKHPADALLLS